MVNHPVDLRDRFRGCMVGLAIGDALGAASESLDEHSVRVKYGLSSIPEEWIDGLVGRERVICAADGLYELSRA